MATLIVREKDRTASENQNDAKFGHKLQEWTLLFAGMIVSPETFSAGNNVFYIYLLGYNIFNMNHLGYIF